PTSLGGEINAATRSLHTNLNRLITSRLPIALPPYTTDSSLYSTGLVHFAHIFLTFESLWTDLTSPASPSTEPTSPLLSFLLVNPYDNPDLFTSPPSRRMLEFLRTLRPKGLARSGRLKRDLEVLLGLHPTDLSVLLAQYPGDKVAAYCNHIRQQVGRKPHVLVAYAWCFYMAVFSGGRWIRGELVKAGPQFWLPEPSSSTTNEKGSTLLSQHGLSFWNFDSDSDGEDIKSEFKARLQAAEDFFTDDERIDVIEEAKEIFKRSAELVAELDEQIGTDYEALKHVDAAQRQHMKREREAAQQVTMQHGKAKESVMWYKRPEITIGALGLGLVACAAFL
ncbi:hypothetical protein BDV96DRAFT_467319, partial [Lophiotrema nucula]